MNVAHRGQLLSCALGTIDTVGSRLLQGAVNLRIECLSLAIGPAILDVLRLKSTAENFFRTGISTAGEASLHQSFEVDWQLQNHW